jgi:hypothetical protein
LDVDKALRVWKYSLGSYSDDKTKPYDTYIAIVRSLLFLSYLITNCFIIGGVIRHWNPMKFTEEKLSQAYVDLGWDVSKDDIHVEIGGTQVSGIEQPEGYNKKWSSQKDDRKYNKDAFIIIKNRSRDVLVKSQPMDREHKPQHPYSPVKEKDIVVNMDGGVGGSWEVKED